MTATTRPAVALEGGCVVLWETKCLLVLEPAEILGLLRHDPEAWARAIKRGKYQRRAESTVRRTNDAAPVQVLSTEEKRSEPEIHSLPATAGKGDKR